MKVLIVGSGGREHTLAWKLAQSKHVQKLYAAPGNGGIQELAECINIKADDIKGLADFAVKNSIDLTVVGPEIPLVLGIVDEFNKRNLKIFGPTKKAAKLEGSKVFAKEIMKKYGIPTAIGEIFTTSKHAIDYIKSLNIPVVVKAEGLAAGKGVYVCNSREEAVNAVCKIMDERIFGDAGNRVIIEECLQGEEVSILAFSDGERVIPLVPSQDHKRAYDNDCGPNTGGMGAYSPVLSIKDEFNLKIQKQILEPIVTGMKEEGIPYCGILYAGLMLTNEGPKVLEFNVRFGDPETQAVLPRLQSDLIEPLLSVISGDISKIQLKWTNQACVCIVLASGGYPGKYEKGFEIEGLNKANSIENVTVFHAGTKKENDKYLTNGGRVLGVTALGATLEKATTLGYQAIDEIKFKDKHFRKDIARLALK